VPFAYYEHLPNFEQRVYEFSDRRHALRIPEPARFHPTVEAIREALGEDDLAELQKQVQRLCDRVFEALGVRLVRVEVREVRPLSGVSELHGFYSRSPGDAPPVLQLWRRTAQKARPVAFRTFLRTLLHEACHHLDFELLGLPESFHTQGFFQRETSLFWQLLPPSEQPRHRARKAH